MPIARRRDQSKYPQLWDGLVGAWYPGAGPSGNTLYDLSGRDNHGTLTNMDTATDWVVNNGQVVLDFDGADDHVEIGNTPIAFFPVVSVWINPTSGDRGPIFGFGSVSGNTNSLFLFNDGANDAVGFNTFNNDCYGLTPSGVMDGKWHHIVTEIRGGGVTSNQIYIDGDLKSLSQVLSSPNTNVLSTNFGIGYNGWFVNPANVFNGQVTDVRIYNRALHADEIKLLSQRPGIAYEPKRRVFYSIPSVTVNSVSGKNLFMGCT